MLVRMRNSRWADRYGTVSLVHRVLVEEGSQFWRSYLATFVLMGIVAGCTAFSAYLIGYVVNATYLSRNFASVVALALITVLIFTIKGFAMYGQAVLAGRIASEINANTQRRLFNKLLREGLGYFADRPTSMIAAQVNYGASAVPAVLNILVTSIGLDGLSLVGLAAVMVMQDPLMSLGSLLVMPLAFLSLRRLIQRARNVALTQFASSAGLMETLQETFLGLRVVKTFGLEDEMRKRFDASNDVAKRSGIELARLSNRSTPVMETLGGFSIALVFLYGGYRVIEMGAAPGDFVSFITAFLLAYAPAKRLIRMHLNLNNNLSGVRTLYQLLDEEPTEPDDIRKPTLQIRSGRVEFVMVKFGYRPNEPIISDMSFVANAGQVTALVGQSGGGKSTAFSLIPRLYDVWSGVIRIDGQNIEMVSRRSLREKIAYVGQDVFLFRGSIRDNIAIGKPDASEAEIVAAAKAAHAHGFIISFPQCYETSVGEHGLQISAGQRQRIAIARALLKDAPIILLDEPTAALDSESECEVQRAMRELCAGRTTLVIAHRLHTVRNADCIHVIERGAVVESGRHEELLHKGGRYSTFYRLQLQNEDTTQMAV
jgi:subfamily B ATP-binding cassette protein MsbA